MKKFLLSKLNYQFYVYKIFFLLATSMLFCISCASTSVTLKPITSTTITEGGIVTLSLEIKPPYSAKQDVIVELKGTTLDHLTIQLPQAPDKAKFDKATSTLTIPAGVKDLKINLKTADDITSSQNASIKEFTFSLKKLDKSKFTDSKNSVVVVVRSSKVAHKLQKADLSQARFKGNIQLTGIGHAANKEYDKQLDKTITVSRRDPSDVIKVGDTYYVWYTKTIGSGKQRTVSFPNGFNGTVWYATSTNITNWVERGMSVGKGQEGKYNDFGSFTPNIFFDIVTRKYYLFYTGVSSVLGIKAKIWKSNDNPGGIGVSSSDSPAGPWVVENNGDAVVYGQLTNGVYDGWRCDDTVMFYRPNDPDGHRYWLFYKGYSRPGKELKNTAHTTRITPMLLATSATPGSGYTRKPFKSNQQYYIEDGHELLMWRNGNKMIAAPNGHGGDQKDRSGSIQRLHTSIDGKTWKKISNDKVRGLHAITAAGAYRPDLTDPETTETILTWGVYMDNSPGPPHLSVYKVTYED